MKTQRVSSGAKRSEEVSETEEKRLRSEVG